MRWLSPIVPFIALLACSRSPSAAPATDPVDPALRQVVADYVGLYRRESLPKWETLFLSSFTVANTRADGSIGMRTRDEFFQAQRQYHARVEGLREDLENVRIEQHGPLASVSADYVVTENGKKNRGKLMLLIIHEPAAWKIHSLIFAYDR